MPYFIARFATTGSARTDVVTEARAFETGEAAVEAARQEYRDGEYVIVLADDAADLRRQAFRDLGSMTDDAPPPDEHQTGPLPGGPAPRRPSV